MINIKNMPSPQEIQKLLKDFKDVESWFPPSFYKFCGVVASAQPTWDPGFLDKIDDVENEVDEAQTDGYIIDYDMVSAQVTLLSIPSEKDLEDDAKFKKYQKALEVYKKLIHDMDDISKDESVLKSKVV